MIRLMTAWERMRPDAPSGGTRDEMDRAVKEAVALLTYLPGCITGYGGTRKCDGKVDDARHTGADCRQRGEHPHRTGSCHAYVPGLAALRIGPHEPVVIHPERLVAMPGGYFVLCEVCRCWHEGWRIAPELTLGSCDDCGAPATHPKPSEGYTVPHCDEHHATCTEDHK